MMETKKCFSCCEEINAEAKQCPNCQSYQTPIYRLLRSSFVGPSLAAIILAGMFAWFVTDRIKNISTYDTEGILIVSESNIQFKDASCGKQVIVIGKVSNKGEQALTDIVFDVEFYDENGRLIDTVSDTVYDLVIPPGSTKSFKVQGSSAANEEIYTTHKIIVAKAAPDRW